MRGFMCNINNEACEDFSWDRCGGQEQGRKLTLCRLKLVLLQSYTQTNTLLKFWQAILRAFVEKKGFTLQFWVHSCVSKFRRYWLQPGSLLESLFRIGVGGLSLWSLHSAFWNRVDHNIEGKFKNNLKPFGRALKSELQSCRWSQGRRWRWR